MQVVGFIIRIYHDARSPEGQILSMRFNLLEPELFFLNFTHPVHKI